MANDGQDTGTNNNSGMIIVVMLLLVAIVIGGAFLMNMNKNDNARTDAVSGAAKDISQTAKDVGSAAQKAAPPATQPSN